MLLFFLCLLPTVLEAQMNDSLTIRRIYDAALTDYTSYRYLDTLCMTTRGRITGSLQAEKAVRYMERIMQQEGFDTVYLQEVMVPQWKRGEEEKARIIPDKGKPVEVPVSALGMSIGTGAKGLRGEVIEIKLISDLEYLGEEIIRGKIVFFNRAMDPKLINTFAAYGGAADQRTRGASEAARYGASGVIVRSMTTALDDHPHTGVMRYADGVEKIPAVAISTNGAELLSAMLKEDKSVNFWFKTNCTYTGETLSYNVIAELRGNAYPEEIITVGGHLDAWDTGEGAHDDGAGCMQSLEVLRLFKAVGIKPQRTLRAVMFMDEEIAQRGGLEYARLAGLKQEKHIFALESDRGGLLPRGFGFSGPTDKVEKMIGLKDHFAPYYCNEFTPGGGGVDIGPLRKPFSEIVLCGFVPDWQRYFDYHHSPNDTFDKVNFRELQLGSAAMTSLIYLVDKNGL